MSIDVPVLIPAPGTGYTRSNGRYAATEAVIMIPKQTLSSGETIGPVYDVGDAHTLRLLCKVTAKSGTSPTLDVTIQTSVDRYNGWRTIKGSDGNSFAQKTNSAAEPNGGLVMSAVTAAGTTPPAVTLTSTSQVHTATLRVECTDISTTGAARGQWIGRYSIDGGVTFVTFTSAATVSVIDANGTDTGIVINIAAGNAAVDNVWTAVTAGRERKEFSGLSRFVRAVAKIGGSSTPTMEATVDGEVVY